MFGSCVVLAVVGSGPVLAQTADQRIRLLEQTVRDLLERDAQKEKTIETLRGEVGALKRGNRGSVGGRGTDPTTAVSRRPQRREHRRQKRTVSIIKDTVMTKGMRSMMAIPICMPSMLPAAPCACVGSA
jgi:hypothetical protein